MRAIILAAGMGTRLRPLTNNKPKGLVEVNGLPMVERQIINLNERGINEIILVTGYLSEQFEYLKEKYNVRLINNDKYDIYNNIYTIYLVKDFLANSYVIESDIFMNNNVINDNLKKSTYFGKKAKNFKKEWIIKSNEEKKIYEIITGDSEEDVIFQGISYWNEKDAKLLSEKIEEVINKGNFDQMYWDDVIKDNIKDLDLYLNELDENDVYEIDSIEDLKNAEKCLFSE